MATLRVEVTAMVSEVYEYEVDSDDMDAEEESLERARDQLLSDMGLESWQVEWATDYIEWEDE